MSTTQRDTRNCQRTRKMLDGWLDGELDPATSDEMARHVAQCPDCVLLRAERERLRGTLRAAAPRFTAPAALRQSVMSALQLEHLARGEPADRARPGASSTSAQPLAARLVSWWQALAFAGAASVATALVTVMLVRSPVDAGTNESPREQVVTRHVASLSGAHLIDVASSDSHVVKPWFQGKIDFAPMVRDLSAQGFILQGARQERIAGRPAVAVVYKIRNHPVNLFIWRGADGGAADARDAALTASTMRGFSVASWAAGGLNFAAVSDAEFADIERFGRALQKTP